MVEGGGGGVWSDGMSRSWDSDDIPEWSQVGMPDGNLEYQVPKHTG